MSDSPYQVLGVGIAPMLGREQLFGQLCRHLTKENPDHVCVVGPKKFGKTVLLNQLASHFKSPGEHYVTSLYWDLRHSTPRTDAEFRRRFARRVKGALEPVQPGLADWLEPDDTTIGDLLYLVFQEMECRRLRFLAVLDGFDHILAGSGITRNLWDQMRTLGLMNSLRLVTGSRGRLRTLCKTEESRTSDFWEIFYDAPRMVGCFEDHDWEGFLAPFDSRGDCPRPVRPQGDRQLDWWGSYSSGCSGRADVSRSARGHVPIQTGSGQERRDDARGTTRTACHALGRLQERPSVRPYGSFARLLAALPSAGSEKTRS